MHEVKTSIALSDIRQIVRQIVERFQPQQVILFGSHAGGALTAESDVDLLVVMDTDEEPLHAAARIAAAVDHPFPLDILVFRPSQWAASLKRKAIFATEVATRGIVLYEA